MKLPGQPGDQWEDDFVLLADVFPTGFHATVLANVQEGASVAIYGAGAVGLMATLSARLQGAGDVYTVDAIPDRLQCARQLGATPVDATKGDPADQILDLRQKNTAWKQGLLPGEEKMKGVLCGIDAVGYETIDYWNTQHRQAKPSQIVTQRLPLDAAPEAYAKFCERAPGYVKVVLKPGLAA